MDVTVTEVDDTLPEIIRVERDFPVSAEALWDWVTRPELTERWFGPWRRTLPDGDEIEIIMNREEGAPAQTARILEVNEKRGYTLAMGGADGAPPWEILILLDQTEGGSRFTLIQPWDAPELRREIQAGWDYYADCLGAAITGSEFPDFSGYLP